MARSREQIMTEWDAVRAKIADGCANSGPRDWLEGVLDEQDHIIAELKTALAPFAVLGARMLALDSSGRHTVRVSMSDVMRAQAALKNKGAS